MNMFNFQLNNLIKQYFKDVKGLISINPIHYIGEIIRENCIGKKFAIWGAGDHTSQLHRYFSVELKEAKFIIDNNKLLKNEKILGYNIVDPSELKNYDLDTILISSYSSSKSIKKQIQSLGIECNAIDFYEYLEQKGVKLESAFYSNPSVYMTLYNLRIKYENSTSIDEKEEILIKIIYSYLQIRDIYNAINFINKYIELDFKNSIKLRDFLKELKNLLNDMKEKLALRRGKDVMLFFFDSLRAKDVFSENSCMKFLNTILENSIYFEKAYSPSIFTYESIPSVFTGKRPFDNGLYKRKTIHQDESECIKYALKNNFKIKIYSTGYWNIIDGPDMEYGDNCNYASQTFWNAICDLTEENKNVLYLLYFEQEIHPPHICGDHSIQPKSHITPFTCNNIVEQTQEEYTKQYKESLKYIDNQLKFYFNIIPSHIDKVIFSDHGQIIEQALSPLKSIGTLAGWHTERYHVPLIINGDNLIANKNKKLYSMINFSSLLKGILEKNIKIKNNKIVEVNFSPINNAVIIEKYKKEGYEDYLYGFKIFLNEKYKLVITGNGKKKAYILPDEFNEIIDLKQKDEIINYFINNDCDLNLPIW